MKRLKAILVLIAMSLTSFSAIASDTAVDGIYYDFDSENKTAIVTYRGNSPYSYSKEYTGDVVIPAKVTYEGVEYAVTAIGERAFDGCSGLTSIISLNTTPPSCDGSSVFYNVDKSIPFYVPKESVDSYKSAKCWSEFTNIIGNMLRLTINDAVNGMVTGAGVYPVDSTATVTATPNAGYAFVKWSDGNTDNPRKIVMTEDVTLEAIFEVDSSPISNVTAEEITVRVVNGTLVVTGASDYLVYDLAGKCMGKPERLERGIYIVVADGNSYKMIVK